MPVYDKFGNPVWFEPGEIRYRYDHVVWVLEHINTLRDGQYPQNPQQTGYQRAGWRSSINARAAFITPAEIAAEVDRRLLRCGLDWYLVNDYYGNGLKIEDIAALHHLDYEDVWNRIQRAIAYAASGPVPRWVNTGKRKGLDYREWIDQGGWHKPKLQENRKNRIRVYRG